MFGEATPQRSVVGHDLRADFRRQRHEERIVRGVPSLDSESQGALPERIGRDDAGNESLGPLQDAQPLVEVEVPGLDPLPHDVRQFRAVDIGGQHFRRLCQGL